MSRLYQILNEIAGRVTATQLSTNADLNNITKEGVYYVGQNHSMSNAPTNKVFTMTVYAKGSLRNQMLIDNDGNMFFRVQFSSGWQTWRKVTATNA